MPASAALRDYLKTRRSVGSGFLKEPGPSPEELREILTIGVRVPDHGKFAPWRLVVIEDDARVAAGEKLAAIQKSRRPDIDEASLDIERKQFLPAPVTIGVLLSPKPNTKSPEIEQLLSAGNVCFNLSHAAFALGFAAVWVIAEAIERWRTPAPVDAWIVLGVAAAGFAVNLIAAWLLSRG